MTATLSKDEQAQQLREGQRRVAAQTQRTNAGAAGVLDVDVGDGEPPEQPDRMVPDTDGMIRCLRWFSPGAEQNLITQINPTAKGRSATTFYLQNNDTAAEQLRSANDAGLNVYHPMGNPRSTWDAASKNQPSKADVESNSVIYFDGDFTDSEGKVIATEQSRLADIDAAVAVGTIPPPGLIINSGNGVQYFWRLREPLEPEQAEGRNRWLIKLLHGDRGVWDRGRLMRVGGGINWPSKKKIDKGCVPVLGRIVRIDDEAWASADQFQWLPEGAKQEAPPSEQPAAKDIDWQKVSEHSGWLKSVADLPNDFSPKGKRIIDHDGNLAELNDALIEAGHVEKKYGSWSDVTCALAAIFKIDGRFTREQIAAALAGDLPCNKHVTKLKEEKAKRRAIDRAIKRSHESKPKAKAVDDGRPIINWWEPSYPQILDRVEKILVERGVGLYQANGRLVHTHRLNVEVEAKDQHGVTRKTGALMIHDVSDARLNEYMTTNINFMKAGRDGDPINISAPSMLSLHYMARHDLWRLPVLTGIVECPTLRSDGTVLSAHGYDPVSGLMLDTNGVVFPEIPDQPSRANAIAALKVVKELLCDFPFVDDASRSVGLSAILTSLVRRQLHIAPVHGFDAPSISTGKSMLADVVSLITTGRPAAVMPLPANEDEAVKVWLSVLRAGDPVISIDNVDRPITGSTMCSIVTQPMFQARVLGASEMSIVPTNVMIMANGNNLIYAADMASRGLKARMDAGVENPDQRSFKYDLKKYIPEHRGEIVAAALTVVRGYFCAGRPFSATPSRFSDWDKLVRGALLWCGEVDPQDTRAAIDDLDPARGDLGSIIDAMRKCFLNDCAKPISSQDIVDRAKESDDQGQALAAALGPHMHHGIITSRGITALLTKHKDTIVSGHRIRRSVDTDSKVTQFRIEAMPTAPAQKAMDL